MELDKRKRPEVWKNGPGCEQWKLHMNYLRAQVNFRQLRAETAGNRYLRRFLPASAGNFPCETIYLRPSQVNLHAPVLQCMRKVMKASFCATRYIQHAHKSTIDFWNLWEFEVFWSGVMESRHFRIYFLHESFRLVLRKTRRQSDRLRNPIKFSCVIFFDFLSTMLRLQWNFSLTRFGISLKPFVLIHGVQNVGHEEFCRISNWKCQHFVGIKLNKNFWISDFTAPTWGTSLSKTSPK